MLSNWGQDFWCRPKDLYDRLRQLIALRQLADDSPRENLLVSFGGTFRMLGLSNGGSHHKRGGPPWVSEAVKLRVGSRLEPFGSFCQAVFDADNGAEHSDKRIDI